jgi:hypothetical protein
MRLTTPFACVCFSLGIVASAAAGDAYPGRAYFGVGGATEVCSADLDLDGDLDVVTRVVGLGISALRVWRGDGTGALVDAGSVAIPSGCSGLALADLDGDLRSDAALVQPSANALVLVRNQGSGSFAAPATLVVPSGLGALLAFAIGDVTGDGIVDVIATTNTNTLRFDGLGALAFAPPVAVSPQLALSTPALGDMDGDGDLDLVGSASGSLGMVLANDGLGHFTVVESEFCAFLFGAFGAETIDVDADGNRDVAFASFDLNMFRGDGAGGLTFNHPINPAGFSVAAVAGGDVDADGYGDLLLGGQFGGAVLMLGGGGFEPGEFGTFPIPANGGPGADVALADLDQDGFDDVLVAPGGGAPLTLWRSRGAGGDFGIHPLPIELPGALARTDFDQDGDDDLVALIVSGSSPAPVLRTFVNDRNGALLAGAATPVEPFTSWLGMADLDGDGRSDAITADGPQLRIRPGLADGSFGPLAATVSIPVGPGQIGGIDTGDVDFDGNADLGIWFVGATACGCSARLLFTDGAFHVTNTISFAGPTNRLTPLSIADVDADSFADVVLTRDNGTSVYRGAANDSVLAPWILTGPTNSTGRGVEIGDFTGDGLLDIAASFESGVGGNPTGTVTVFRSTGPGGFVLGPSTTFPLSLYPRDLDAADLDADGDLDLVATCALQYGSATRGPIFATLTSDASGSFVVEGYHHPHAQCSMHTANFDGDGAADVVPTYGSTYAFHEPNAACPGVWVAHGAPCVGGNGVAPKLTGVGCPTPGGSLMLQVTKANANTFGLFVLGSSTASFAFAGGCGIYVAPPFPIAVLLPIQGTQSTAGAVQLAGAIPNGLPPLELDAQFLQPESTATGFSSTNGLRIVIR